MTALGSQIGMRADVLVVGFFFGAAAAGDYSVGSAIPAVAASLLFALIDVGFPRLAALGPRSLPTGSVLMRASALLAALGFGVIAAEADVLLRVWVGNAPELSVTIARIYALVWALNAPGHVLVLLLISRSRHWFLGPLVLAEAVFSLSGSILLASAGLQQGPAIATLATLLVSNVVLLPILTARSLEIAILPLARGALTGFAVGGGAAAVVGVVASLVAGDIATLIVTGLLTVLLAALLVKTDATRLKRMYGLLRYGGWRVWLRQRSEARRVRRELPEMRAVRPDIWLQGKPPLVTVRIATYDRGRLVAERAIASAQAQTHQNLEILVVGDHCDQATEDAVLSVADKRLRFVNLPVRGAYPSRPEHRWMVAGEAPMNHALDIAAGEWLAPLDDDDEFTPDHVEALLDACLTGSLDFAFGVADMEISEGEWTRVGNWPLREGTNRSCCRPVFPGPPHPSSRHRLLAAPRTRRLEPVAPNARRRCQDGVRGPGGRPTLP